MLQIITTLIILAALAPVIAILRWKRDWVMARMSPREMLMLDDPEERRRVSRLGFHAWMTRGKTWSAIAGYILGLLVLGGLPCALMLDSPWLVWGISVKKISAVLAVVVGLQIIPILHVHRRRWMRMFLREYLNEHGIPVCRNCGYDLRGQAGSRCPECGADSRQVNVGEE